MRGAGRRVRRDFSNTEDERSTSTPQVGTCHPTATIREWTGWPPVPPGRRTPAGASRRVLLSYDGPRKCAWRSRLPWDNLSRGGGERRKASALYGRWLFLFPQRTTEIRIADCFTVTKGVRYGRSNLPRRIYIPSRKNHIHCHACLQRRGRAYA